MADFRPTAALRNDLLAWFDRHKRDLPWRRTRDPYAIWVSEVMLQQTQVATVIPYWKRFLERFPDVTALAQAELPEVFALWRGLGYYSRARNLHRAAQAIVSTHGGKLPSDAAALLKLPGFGRYTAGAVASIAFGEAAPLVDGNVARVFSRLFLVEGAPGDRAREKKLWALAEEAVALGKRPGDWNQALMELGATVCRAEHPSCLLCPVRSRCGAFAHGRVDELPLARVRAARQAMQVAVAVCRRGETFLFARRAEGGLFGGLWELPSVEVTPGASHAQMADALVRALGSSARVGASLGAVKRVLTHRALTLELFEVELARLRAMPSVQEWRWATAAEADRLGMSTAMAKAFALARDAGQRTVRVSGSRRRGSKVSVARPPRRRPRGAATGPMLKERRADP
ncbi:MAG: A/G-specific adenine glycosylase [Myxococcaceae bacterium]|nr:A/G-specific adenine glycosylase [Myxococcaceae bacterium]